MYNHLVESQYFITKVHNKLHIRIASGALVHSTPIPTWSRYPLVDVLRDFPLSLHTKNMGHLSVFIQGTYHSTEIKRDKGLPTIGELPPAVESYSYILQCGYNKVHPQCGWPAQKVDRPASITSKHHQLAENPVYPTSGSQHLHPMGAQYWFRKHPPQ